MHHWCIALTSSLCHCCTGNDQYGACAAPIATLDQNGGCGWYFFATAVLKGAWGRWKQPPRIQLSWRWLDMVLCCHDTTPSANCTQCWNHTNIEFKPWTNYWYGFSTGGGWLMALIFLGGTQQKLMLLAIRGSGWEIGSFWGQFLNPNVSQDTIGKLSSRAFNWCNTILVVLVWNHSEIIQLLFLKVKNSAGSMRFWLCPD